MGPFSPFCNDLVGKKIRRWGEWFIPDGKGVEGVRLAMPAVSCTRCAQGVLDEGTGMYPDISAELPGVELEAEEHEYQTITDEPEPDFRDLAGAALHNAGIDTNAMIWDAQGDAMPQAP